MELTPLERTVLDALRTNADNEAGGDFALVETMKPRPAGLSAQALGGVLTSLQTKRVINVDINYVNGAMPGERGKRGTKVTQVTFND